MWTNKVDTANATGSADPLLAVLPQNAKPWYRQKHLLRLNFIIVSLVLFSSANGYDGSLMNGLEALEQWKSFMDKPTGAWLGWINGIYLLGGGVGYPSASWIAGRYGRKPGVYLGFVVLALGVALQTAAQNTTTFLLARLFIGFASALFGNAVPLLINEIAYPTHRGIFSALFMSGWYVGGSVAAWVVFASRTYDSSWAWRLPSLLQCLVPLVGLPGFFLAPESPRWLVSVGRLEEARAILIEFHAAGDEVSPLAIYEFQEITSAIHAEVEANSTGSYIEMIRTPGNRRRLAISISLGYFAQWVGNGVISYYLSMILTSVGITEVRDQTLISACLQMWDLIFSGLGAFLVDKLGRRPLFLSSAAIMFISYVLVTALSGSFAATGSAATGGAVIPFLFIFFAGYCIALTPFLTSYPCEIWPFRLRSRGLTVTWLATITAMFFNTFVNPIALAAIEWKYYFVFVAVLIMFGITAYLFYPETKGYTLEQIAFIFDGENDLVNHSAEDSNAATDLKKNTESVHTESI